MRSALLFILLVDSLEAQEYFRVPFEPDVARLSRTDLREMLALLCPGQEYVGKRSGCKVCLDGSAFGFGIVNAIAGHFRDAKSDDVLVYTAGCEARVAGSGGRILFTRTRAGWSIAEPYRAARPSTCRKAPIPGGRDGLLCFSEDFYSEGTAVGLLWYGETDLARLRDNRQEACTAARDGRRITTVQSSLGDVVIRRSGDARATIVVNASCTRGKLGPRAMKSCREDWGATPIRVPGLAQRFRLEYVLDGSEAVPTADTRRAAELFAACVQ
jgi:hypothetical protein